LKIEWNENPLKTKVYLDDKDRHILLRNHQAEEMMNICCGIDSWLAGSIRENEEPTLEKIHQEIKRWRDICNMKPDDDYIQIMEDSLLYTHIGDCTCMAATCIKCLAEESLGIDTIEGLGKHPGAKIFSLFNKYETIDEVLDQLSQPSHYEKPDNWPTKVEYEKHIPRWEKERKRALEWLKKYKETKLTNTQGV